MLCSLLEAVPFEHFVWGTEVAVILVYFHLY
jgi:hypothetical protein